MCCRAHAMPRRSVAKSVSHRTRRDEAASFAVSGCGQESGGLSVEKCTVLQSLKLKQTGDGSVFGISMWEVVLILVVALIVLGPKQLTETARVLGRLYREVQKMASDVRNSVDLDSLTSMDHYPEPSTHKPEQNSSPKEVESVLPGSGEKSGPDFYADLLESSKEEEQEEVSASSPQEPEESATDQAERGGSASQPDHESPDQSRTATLDAEGKQRVKSE